MTINLTAIEYQQSQLPSFAALTGTIFTFTPTSNSQVGTYRIDITLSDGVSSPVYSFYIIVS